jgi:hypothetical protein
MEMVRRAVWGSVMALALGCDGGGTSSDSLGSGGGSSSAASGAPSGGTFDVRGVWEGSASDDDSEHAVRLTLTSNGGSYGQELTGTLEIEGVATMDFDDGYIDVLASAQRVFSINAADDDGYTYSLRGTFTSKRLDDGQLQSSNPALDIDIYFLETALMRAD